MVDGLMLPGLISRMQAYQQDGFITHQTGASLTVSLLAIITQLEDSNHVELSNQPQNVKNHVPQDIQLNIKKIFITPRKFTQFQRMLLKFKQKL